MADEVDQKDPPERVVDSFVCQDVARIEEITWMLPVERGDDLPGVEIRQRDDPHFRETKLVFNARGEREPSESDRLDKTRANALSLQERASRVSSTRLWERSRATASVRGHL